MPITSIRNFVYWTSLIISAFLFIFSRTIRDDIATLLQALKITNDDVILFAVFFVGLFLLLCARLVSEGIPKYIPWARSTMMGNNFFEGQWLDAVYEDDKRTVKSVGLIHFFYQKGQLVANGSDHNPDGAMHSMFESIISRIYDTGEFRYCYEARMFLEPEFSTHRGYAEYSFLATTNQPTEFTGVYSSSSTGLKHINSGNKITPELLAELKLDDKIYHLTEKDRKTLITAFVKYKTRP